MTKEKLRPKASPPRKLLKSFSCPRIRGTWDSLSKACVMKRPRTKSGESIVNLEGFQPRAAKRHWYLVANRISAVIYHDNNAHFQFIQRFSNKKGKRPEIQLDSDRPG